MPEGPRQPPSLAQCCHRIIVRNIDLLQDFSAVPFRVLQPILEQCSVQTLLKLERKSPQLATEDDEVWRVFCARDFPATTGSEPVRPPDSSWRDHYQVLTTYDEERMLKTANKLRQSRDDERESKRMKQVQITNKLPPTKRRGAPGRPLTLFEKAKDQTKRRIQVHSSPSTTARPPRSAAQSISPRQSISPATATTQQSIWSQAPAVQQRIPTRLPNSNTNAHARNAVMQTSAGSSPSPCCDITSRVHVPVRSSASTTPQSVSVSPPPPPLPPSRFAKHDPMAILFLPKKHRTISSSSRQQSAV